MKKPTIKRRLQALLDKLRGKRKLSKLERSQIRFHEQYPAYEIGSHSYGVPIVHDWGEGRLLHIGDYCSIASNVQIFLGGNHRSDWVSTYPFPAFFAEAKQIQDYCLSKGDVVIGHDVWIGQNVMIMSGITIETGAVIAAGAVVSKHVSAYEIVGGNPAKHIKWRFDEATRQALLATAWWSWPEAEIKAITHLLCSENISDFLAYAGNRQAT